MAPRSNRTLFVISFIILSILTSIPGGSVRAMAADASSTSLPVLEAFVEQIHNGQGEELRGIYIDSLLAAPVVQQPSGMEEFVSPWQNIVTQFRLASSLGSTGLMAHNYLAGERFALLQPGQEIRLVYGDGRVVTYAVAEILQYQALDPDSTSSAFVDLQTGSQLAYSQLFAKMYNRPGQVVFQTCIAAEDNSAWGRLFVIAEPVSE
jgi:hypothetical protein